MRLTVVGLSHRTAPVEVREQVAFSGAALDEAMRRTAAGFEGEAMIVSTCNRVEVYVATRDGELARREVERLLAEAGRLEAHQVGPHLYAHEGEAAVRHLFRVASSLDSMVVGEPQILGQVKAAFDAAARAGTVGAVLGQLVPRAFATAKRVRSETEIARSSASVASAAVELGRHIFGDLHGKDVLMVGAGKMAGLAARHLRAAGCGHLMIVNRTAERAEELGRRTGGEARPWSELEPLLARAAIVLCSTGAPRPVITREMVQRAMRARRGRWLCFIDIAVPRDVEAEVGGVENVYLYDVDELGQLVDDHMADRRREAERAERIVGEEIERLLAAQRSQGVVPTIKALRERFLGVARAEVERTLGRMGQATERERKEVQVLADAIVNKLLHVPLTALKRHAESEALVEATRLLFGLADDGAPPATTEASAAPAAGRGAASVGDDPERDAEHAPAPRRAREIDAAAGEVPKR